MASKRMNENEYNSFKTRYNEANSRMIDRVAAIDSVLNDFLEKNLDVLGVTGVEDGLQVLINANLRKDDVKPTLESLRNAGIKIWMLTGDKTETATCIAISSKLVSRNQNIAVMSKGMM